MSRVNRQFIKEVEEKIKDMTKGQARSYLFGLLKVPGNKATTTIIQKMWENTKEW